MNSERPINKNGNWEKGTWIKRGKGLDIDYSISRLYGDDKRMNNEGIKYGFNGLPFSNEQDSNEFFRKGYEIGCKQKEAREKDEINKAGELWFLDGQELEDSDLANDPSFRNGYNIAKFNARTEEIINKRGR